MRIVESVAVAKGHQRNAGRGEFLAAGNSAFEGHQVGIVENADAHMLRIVPAGNLGALHVPGNLAQDSHANAGSPIGHQQSRIFRAPGVKDLARNRSVLRQQRGFILRPERNSDGFDIEMGNVQRVLAAYCAEPDACGSPDDRRKTL